MRLILLAVLVTGCMKHSEKYCAMHPDDLENCAGSGDDGGMTCLGDEDCTDPSTPVCTDDQMCVQCTVEDDHVCAADGRICSGARTCTDCTQHSDCLSNVCQANGRCANVDDVAYVAMGGSGPDCTQATPCRDLIVAEATAKPVIKVSGSIADPMEVEFSARSTAIYAEPGAQVTRVSGGNIIEISGDNTELAIHGLRITGASGGGTGGTSNGILIQAQANAKLTLDRAIVDSNEGSGVRAPDGGDVTITRSVIALNIGNTGVYLANGTFSITNTIIAGNGKQLNLTTGGAHLQPSGASTFEFNTVVDNLSTGGTGNYRGISCFSSGFAVKNSIIFGNETNSCDVSYSMFQSGEMESGTGNMMTSNPMFVSNADPKSSTYFRLMPGSPAKDKADTAATLMMDIDGNTRPAGPASDMGADEVSP